MLAIVSTGVDSFIQLITVLFIFIFVLAITYFTTRWIANYQKGVIFNKNMELVETYKIGVNKFLQIVKVGDKYLVIALCKDSVTMLTEIPKEQLQFTEHTENKSLDFKEIFEKAKKLKSKAKYGEEINNKDKEF